MVFAIFFDKINLRIDWLVQAGAGADGQHFPGEIFEAPQKKGPRVRDRREPDFPGRGGQTDAGLGRVGDGPGGRLLNLEKIGGRKEDEGRRNQGRDL
jgi:hypothetical protein